ncbi:tRNA pseudouridine synthase II TruB [Penicillium malachiteum]|uniref:tRNA pseudouridine(55) synthase n=1 Tax=Penicillium malachiteum TaxID=1324776 RepID=A0AAD6HIF3_9EURO|nr:tRNA pseudouridine synthase II TruB [Penicillium malachiteum]
MSGEKILEGCFAIHKPQGVTSADVLRTCQKHFNPSKTFAPWLEDERARRKRESSFQKKRRRDKRLEVKIGHGGTLDPLATGILIAGVGKGTKCLPEFLGCTKSYETIVLFGAETDTYDRLGKIVRRAPYEHVTQEKVEEALKQFRGKIMQRPPIFSALRIDGKRLYEYAREGKMPPVEIKTRPVEAVELEIVEWFEPGTHEYKFPEEEMQGDEKVIAEKLLDKGDAAPAETETEDAAASSKRKSPPADSPQPEDQDAAKKQKVGESGEAQPVAASESEPKPESESAAPEPASVEAPTVEAEQPVPQPPAVKIKMTVTSGFYVRSLAHDLGKAVGSCALMSELVRSRQGDFTLEPENVLEYKDLEAGEEVWGPKVAQFLSEWEAKRAAKAEAEAAAADK